MQAIEAAAIQQNIPRIFAEVSITAKLFFMRKGFDVVREQVVVMRGGVEIINFIMEKYQYPKPISHKK